MQTKYSKVKQVIKSRILDGTYVPNQRISSENELMKEFSVSRHTIRIAIGELVSEGWLYREQGAGTFCADRTENQNRNPSVKKNIAIMTTYISDYIFPSIIRGAESYLSQHGYQVSLYSTNNDIENEKRILENLITQNIDGVIVEPTKSAFSNPNINYYFNFERMKIPYMMINAFYDELEPVCLIVDDEKGGFVQTEHLIQKGHRNIVGFFKTDDIQGVKRMKGYIKAHRKNQVPINPNHLINYNSEQKKTKPMEELTKLLNNHNEMPTAIVCYNDELALQLLDVLREKKLQVPEDISMVGFDDSFLATASEVKLTTVAHPKTEMGERAAKMIIGLVENHKKEKKVESYIYQPELIIRSSTKEISTEK
ncbi:GntR family transcriptional regulator [Alkalihalobacillus alcalophilus ATCC 27647 = CGMCC 1.3604]|uniref:GntR family transcriptional regulator n=1 Tax=Alkalihalobacillus alcalophilus ATCC 27647 = CGMCC 1.3604 TaxID=1218173 RepID=A0A4S4K0E5_ALKAL|nr:GntR family transcriptional regulator [Alkalihalobacillus alcalophilus]MED1563738.1 GntR family transcriptional regulator [Alkalihalobacillus alcalophilus]THG91044.1 GntR family transcriptional regulator [Alkalihalobacillus alcalophilus ATCC 27647 = CGMCC 1.3604]